MTERLGMQLKKKNRPTIFSHFWETKFYCDFSANIVGECIGTIRKKLSKNTL